MKSPLKRAAQALTVAALAGTAVLGVLPATASASPAPALACSFEDNCWDGPFYDISDCHWAEFWLMAQGYTTSGCFWSDDPWSGYWVHYWK